MLETIQDLPAGIAGLKAIGKVSKADYDQVLAPMLDSARREGRHVRFLYQLGAEFEGFTPGGAWEDAKIGMRSMRLFEGCAVVTDHEWVRNATRFASYLMPCPVRVFSSQEHGQAVAWLESLPEGAGVSHRLIADGGVIVVEIKQALRAQDFDAIALTADHWIQSHGDLHGLVLHAPQFPGWENLSSTLRHLQFVRDHQRKIKKLALSVDSPLADVVPSIAELFGKVEVRKFGFDELDNAIAWASARSETNAAKSGDGAGRDPASASKPL